MRNFKLFVSFFCLVFVLSACGFKLRGAMNLPPQMHQLYLDSYAPYGELTRELKQNLKLSHVNLVASADQAPLTLLLSNETITTNQTTVASIDQRRNYAVHYVLNYSIKNQKGKLLVGPVTIQKSKTITLVVNEVLGNSNKLNQATESMRQDAIYEMMLQLSSKALAAQL